MTDPTELDTADAEAGRLPPMTELQRIALDSLATTVRLCDAAGLALMPGPTSVTVWVPAKSDGSRYRQSETFDLPQIIPRPLGRHAPRRRRAPATASHDTDTTAKKGLPQ